MFPNWEGVGGSRPQLENSNYLNKNVKPSLRLIFGGKFKFSKKMQFFLPLPVIESKNFRNRKWNYLKRNGIILTRNKIISTGNFNKFLAISGDSTNFSFFQIKPKNCPKD